MPRRVGITGLGAVSGLGLGMGPLWDGLVEGRSAIGRIARFDPSGFPCRLGAEVKDFSAKDHVPKHYRKAVKVMARDTELAVGAAKFAVEDAGLTTRATMGDAGERGLEGGSTTYPTARMGCHIGAGLIAAEAEELTMALASARAEAGGLGGVDLRAWGRIGMENLTPLWLLKYLPNMPACHVTILHGAEGPSNTITCAEASGLLSIGESTRVIQRGDADLCFSGGAESKINLMGLLRMDLAGRVAHTGDSGDGALFVRPFADRESAGGGLLGEGGGIAILEEMGGAIARGARVYAEITGYGSAQSGPVDSVKDDDEGYRFAVEAALRDAGVHPDEVDAIVPLGCGVPEADLAEAGALRAVFGERLTRIPIVTSSPNIGNCMAGAGALLALIGAKCVHEQRLPARLNAGNPARGMNAGCCDAQPAPLGHVLVCSGSLGGQNAALVLSRVPNVPQRARG